jgi:fibronectin type 3 domain-containing protein
VATSQENNVRVGEKALGIRTNPNEGTNMKTLLRTLSIMVCLVVLSGEAFGDPPAISSFSPTSGPIGTTVTITGDNFDPTPANNIVYFGAVKAAVVSASSTSLDVTVPVGTTFQPISVTVAGLTACSKTPFIVTYPGEHVINSKSFSPKVDFPAGDFPRGVTLGDLDGDGKSDVVSTNWSGNSISVLRNTSVAGTVSFAEKVDFPTGANPFGVTLGDVDSDGRLDLIVLNNSSNSVSVLRNTSTLGNVSFEGKIDFGTAGEPQAVVLADFDGDGLLDIAVTNQLYPQSVSVLRNTSVGSSINFAERMEYITASHATGIAVGDLDGDGKPEIVAGNESSGSVSIFPNSCSEGTITFGARQDFVCGSIPRGISLGDADGDGKLDLFVCNQGGNSVSVLNNNSSLGSLSFDAHVDFATGTEPFAVALGDVDGDGKVDIAASNLTSNSISVLHNSSLSGTVSFDSKVDFPTGQSPYGMVLGDIDGDGKLDIVTANFNDNNISVLWNFTQFTDIGAGLPQVWAGSASWGDYDNDGDLDILITGLSYPGMVPIARIYRNDGGTFVDIGAGLTGINEGRAAWGDYDNDGDLDILISGNTKVYPYSPRTPITKVYQNNGGTFTDIGANLIAVYSSVVAWGDYDNDGDLDIFLAGDDGESYYSKIYRNDGGTFVDINAVLVLIPNGSAAWGDYDNDGDLDLLLTGASVSKIYRNDNGTFVDIGANLEPLQETSSIWGDYDNDGDLDILLTGFSTGWAPRAKVYRNDSGTFVDIGASLHPVGYGAVAWGDLDNDGDLDILLTGSDNNGYVAPVYRNDEGTFIDIDANLRGVYRSSATWGDYDNDGDLDILINGGSGSGWTGGLYRNNSSTANATPAAPSNLSALVNGKDVTFSWNKSTDAETPQNGLTYNLAIGTSPNAVNTLSPMSDRSNGYRRIIGVGNTNHNASWTIKGLHDGHYYWSVQAIDNAFAGSLFATEQSLIIAVPPATPQALVAVAGNGQVTLGWSRDSESDFIRYRIYGGTSPSPTTEVDSTAGGNLSDTSKTITGLTNGTLYYFRVTAVDSSENESGYSNEVSATPGQPTILSVKDVPNDQGGRVTVRWSASALDDQIHNLPSYSIWRAIPEGLQLLAKKGMNVADAPEAVKPRRRLQRINGVDYAWEWIATQPAHRFANYSYTAETLYDSMSTTNGRHYFLVSAQTSDPYVYYDSNIDSGYSVDNLSPYTPLNAGLIAVADNRVLLRWDQNRVDPDIAGYAVYRSTVDGFPIADSTRLFTTTDTTVVDSTLLANEDYYYRVTAVDIHGNESQPTEQLLSTLALTSRANIRVLLEGPYNSGTLQMNKTLNTGGCLAAHFGSILIPAEAVDSINIELRNTASNPTTRKFRPAWLLTDGTIRDFSDTTKNCVQFDTLAGNYFLVIRHRNHIPIMTAVLQALNGATPQAYDFGAAQTQAYGTDPMADLGSGRYGMISGDTNGDGIVDATDRSSAWNDRLQTGYKDSDVNLDGIVDASDRSEIWNMRLLQTKVP